MDLRGSADAAGLRDAHQVSGVSGFDVARGSSAAEAEDGLSPEDKAWVDSCLAKDGSNGPDGGDGRSGDLTDDGWAALAEAFVDALALSNYGDATATATQEIEKTDENKKNVFVSSAEANGGGETSPLDAFGDELMMFESEAEVAEDESSSPTASAYAATFYNQPSPTLGLSFPSERSSAVEDQFDGAEGGSPSNSSNVGLDAADIVIGNEFPEGPEQDEKGGTGDAQDELSNLASYVDEVELTRDIFKVWVLDANEDSGDEEEFGWQVKRALEGSSAGGGTAAIPAPVNDVSDAAALYMEELGRTNAVALDDEDSLEALIAGIDDISLAEHPPPNS